MFSLHDMTADTGLPSDNADTDDEVPTAGPNSVRLPAILNLSYERCVVISAFLWSCFLCSIVLREIIVYSNVIEKFADSRISPSDLF